MNEASCDHEYHCAMHLHFVCTTAQCTLCVDLPQISKMNYTSYHCHYADLHLFPIPPFPYPHPPRARALPVIPSCTCFRRSMKRTMIGLSVLGGAAFLAVALILPPFACFRPGYAGLVAMSTVAGVLRGGLDPLFFETSAEVREGRERRKEERKEEEKRRLNCAVRCRVLVYSCVLVHFQHCTHI